MCVSFWPTQFSQTITGTYEVLVDNRIQHVLWYQNRVGSGQEAPYFDQKMQIFEIIVRQALARHDWKSICAGPMSVHRIEAATVEEEIAHRKAGGNSRTYIEIVGPQEVPKAAVSVSPAGNCLIIPLLGSWSSIRLLNTTDVPKLLDDIATALNEPVELRFKTVAGSYGGGGGVVFLQFSIYDIVIAENASSLPGALEQIIPHKRPKVNDEVFRTLEEWYQCPIAVCCFNNGDTGTAKPLAFAFEPLYPDKLVVYTLDAHKGKPPDPTAQVRLDHSVFVGSYLTPPESCAKINYSDRIPNHIEPYMPRNIMGTHIRNRKLENGDIVFSTSDVRAGKFDGLRTLPPFGPHHLPRIGDRVTRALGYAVESGTQWGDF